MLDMLRWIYGLGCEGNYALFEFRRMNDDTGPQHLDKHHSQIRGMARHARRKHGPTPGARRITYKKNPRQYCALCFEVFDFAICEAKEPAKGRCPECSKKLSDGWAALMPPMDKALWVPPGPLKPGLVRSITAEDYAAWMKKNGGKTSE